MSSPVDTYPQIRDFGLAARLDKPLLQTPEWCSIRVRGATQSLPTSSPKALSGCRDSPRPLPLTGWQETLLAFSCHAKNKSNQATPYPCINYCQPPCACGAREEMHTLLAALTPAQCNAMHRKTTRLAPLSDISLNKQLVVPISRKLVIRFLRNRKARQSMSRAQSSTTIRPGFSKLGLHGDLTEKTPHPVPPFSTMQHVSSSS